MLQETYRAESAVSDHEEHTDDFSHEIDAPKGDKGEDDDRSQDGGVHRFIGIAGTRLQRFIPKRNREYAVTCQGLQRPGGD